MVVNENGPGKYNLFPSLCEEAETQTRQLSKDKPLSPPPPCPYHLCPKPLHPWWIHHIFPVNIPTGALFISIQNSVGFCFLSNDLAGLTLSPVDKIFELVGALGAGISRAGSFSHQGDLVILERKIK